MAIHTMLATVFLLTLLKHGSPIGAGTGFFYTSHEHLFLVTAQHVCRNDVEHLVPDTLRLSLPTDPQDATQRADFKVPLYRSDERLWQGPAAHPEADLAVLALNQEQLHKRFFFRAWAKASVLPSNMGLDPGDDLFIVGPPFSGQQLPRLHYAMAASSYRVPFRGQPLLLTNAHLPPAASGSPVIAAPQPFKGEDKSNSAQAPDTVYYL